MRHIRLEAWRDLALGELGLVLCGNKGEEVYSDTSGRLIAHDLLEHQNGIDSIGCCGDELEALGAMYQVRGRHGDFCPSPEERSIVRWHDPIETTAGDILNVAVDTHGMGWWPGTNNYRTHRHPYDDDFRAILEKVSGMFDYNVDDEFPRQAFLDDALHLLRTGFRKATRRFGMGYEGIETFKAVAEACRGAARMIDFEGQQFRLSYGNGEARCEPIYEEAW
jgi:hypothetical protein